MPADTIAPATLGKLFERMDERIRNLEMRVAGRGGLSFLGDGTVFAPQGVTIGGGGGAPQTVTGDTVPQPTNLVTSTGANENRIYIDTAWLAATGVGSDQISGYEVRWSSPGGVTQSLFTTALGCRLEPLQPNTTYTIEVRSVSKLNRTSAPLTGTQATGRDSTVPDQVFGLTLGAGLRSVTASWTAVSNSDVANGNGEYEIWLDTANTFNTGNLRTKRVDGTVASFSDLTPSTTYYVKIRAVDSSGNAGSFSSTQNVATIKANTVDISNNAITAPLIAAGSVSSDYGHFGNVDAAVLNVGFLDVARLRALSIVASKLSVQSGGDNLLTNSSFEKPGGGPPLNWNNYTTGAGSGYSSLQGASNAAGTINGLYTSQIGTGTGYLRVGIYQAIANGDPYSRGIYCQKTRRYVYAVSVYATATMDVELYADYFIWDYLGGNGFTSSGGTGSGRNHFVIPANTQCLLWAVGHVDPASPSDPQGVNCYLWATNENGTAIPNNARLRWDNAYLAEGDLFTGWAANAAEILPGTITGTMLNASVVLVGQEIKSTNYVAGSAGWRIAGSGVAEFSNVTVRGTVTASTITGSTILGTIITGGTFRTASSGARVEFSTSVPGGVKGVGFYTGDAIENTAGYAQSFITGSGNARIAWFSLSSPLLNNQGIASVNIKSRSVGGLVSSRISLAADFSEISGTLTSVPGDLLRISGSSGVVRFNTRPYVTSGLSGMKIEGTAQSDCLHGLLAAGGGGGGSGGAVRAQGGSRMSWNWDGTYRMYVDTTNVKNFIIDHPADRDRWLIHTTLEGPENAVYYRGRGQLEDGNCWVQLPPYFEALAKEEGRTVQVTAILRDYDVPRPGTYTTEDGWVTHQSQRPYGVPYLATTEVVDGWFVVVQAGGFVCDDCEFFWEVKAVRKDVPDLFVEPRREEVAVYGDGPYKWYSLASV